MPTLKQAILTLLRKGNALRKQKHARKKRSVIRFCQGLLRADYFYYIEAVVAYPALPQRNAVIIPVVNSPTAPPTPEPLGGRFFFIHQLRIFARAKKLRSRHKCRP